MTSYGPSRVPGSNSIQPLRFPATYHKTCAFPVAWRLPPLQEA